MVTVDTTPLKEWFESLPKNKDFEKLQRFNKVLFTDPEPQVGQTPKEIIWTKNKAKLYRYQPNKVKTNKVPILMIYALINKPYILDLYPGNSFIEYLTYIPRAVKKVLKQSFAKEITMFGYCMGGTMTAIFTALYQKKLPIRNVVLLTSPIDFEDAGLYTNWLDKRYFKLDNIVETFGNVPFEFIDFGNKLLNPLSNTVGVYVNVASNIENEEKILNWKLMQKWLNDGVPFPGEAYRQWIREFYQENKLINDELEVRGERVLLSNITANLLNIVATRDNIVLPQQIEPLNDKVSSKNKTLHVVNAGHVSVITGKRAVAENYPFIEQWITENSK